MPNLRSAVFSVFALFASAGFSPAGELVAPRPPLGWNSFDAYDCRINEQEFKVCVDWLAGNLKPYGYEYAVVDYIWFNPKPGVPGDPKKRFGHPDIRLDAEGRPIDRLVIDEFGRLLPAPERFPSAVNGAGFKPLADYTHSKGMKFGLHIMRGIARQACYDKLPIKGATFTAADIAEPFDTCGWCNNMFGVDPSKPGAQEYYDSLMELYASWGVDFIKADDTMFPPYHAGEIELMRKAIDKCGRPMVLSLSCGDAPISQAKHMVANANMWRISADFWDEWPALNRSFGLLNSWSPWIQANHWPDADMLPIGRLSLKGRPHGPERNSKFTWDEHRTLMTLFGIARSPLIWGGDPLTSSAESVSYLQNRELLEINQTSTDNRQVFNILGLASWVATDPKTGDRFVALFNQTDSPSKVTFVLERESLRGKYKVRDLWQHQDLPPIEGELSATVAPHGAELYRLSKLP